MESLESVASLSEWIFGGLLVVIYASGRFGNPRSHIASTTIFAYRTAQMAYLSAALVLFVLLSQVLVSSPQIIRAIVPGEEGLHDLSGLASPLLAALIMTALIPNSPVLKKIDDSLLAFFRDLGNIPFEVIAWRDRLCRIEPNMSPDARHALSERLEEIRASFTDLQFEPDGSLRYEMTRSAYLTMLVDGFAAEPKRYPRVLIEFAEEYNALRDAHAKMIASAARCLSLVDAPRTDSSDDPPVLECRQSLKERCRQVQQAACQLLARGILRNERTESDRRAKLESLGFNAISSTTLPLDIHQLVTVVFVVFAAMALVALFFQPGRPGPVFVTALMVAFIFGGAVFCAVIPRRWSIADLKENGKRPVASYALSGFMAVACGIVISVLFKSFTMGGFIQAVQDLRLTYPWLLLTFMVTVTLAFMADNWHRGKAPVPVWGRRAEACAMALILITMFFLVRHILSGMDAQGARVPPPMMAIASAAIGLVLGGFVPHWCRESEARAESRKEEAIREQQISQNAERVAAP